MAQRACAWRALLVASAVALAVTVHAQQPWPQFGDVGGMVAKFYEAQMSGDVSPTLYFPWKQPSHTDDGNGPDSNYYLATGATGDFVDLSGGWYEDGGYVKNSLSMGSSASLIAYAAVTWQTTARRIGAWNTVKTQVKWVADYFAKCNRVDSSDSSVRVFVGQIGDMWTDDRYNGPSWTAPGAGAEGTDAWRPVWTITTKEGRGADVLGQASATAAAAAVMAVIDGEDATTYVDLAVSLYEFSMSLTGVFIIPEGNITELSRTYRDDQTWAAGWLCRLQIMGVSIHSADYCRAAMDNWDMMQAWRNEQTWMSSDVMHLAAALMMRDNWKASGSTRIYDGHLAQAEYMLDKAYEWWTQPGIPDCTLCYEEGLCYTPTGRFIMYKKHSAAMYTANMAMVALASVSRGSEEFTYWRENLDAQSIVDRQCWAYKHMAYLLGAGTSPNGRSYVVGSQTLGGFSFTYTPVYSPRHKSSACTDTNVCSSPYEPNTYTLYGALVGGPGEEDGYYDSRTSSGAHVSINHNAGFLGAMMGLASLEFQSENTGSNLKDFYCDGSTGVYDYLYSDYLITAGATP